MRGWLQASSFHFKESQSKFTFYTVKNVQRVEDRLLFWLVFFDVRKEFVPEFRRFSPMGSTSRSVNLAPSIVMFGDGAAMTVSTVD